MSFDPYQPRTATGAEVIDPGLQSYMRGVFNTMGLGLVVTGLTAFGVANTPALYNLIFGNSLISLIVMLAPLGIIFFGFTPARVARMSLEKLTVMFTIFSALIGLSMATIFAVYTAASITQTFFVTAATFAGMSLFGYTTRRDLTRMGSFLFMGLIGIILAMIVNIFLKSPAVDFAVSVIGVLVFTGLTAWDVQRLKESYAEGHHDANTRQAVMGALSLYLNFINLFQFLLQFMGARRD